MKIINPSNNQIIKEVDSDTKESLKEKFNQLKIGQKEWAKRSVEDRVNCLKTFSKKLIEPKNLESLERGTLLLG